MYLTKRPKQLTQKVKFMNEGKFNIILFNTPLTCELEIWRTSNMWKLERKQRCRGLNTRHPESTCYDTILNCRLTQKLKLMDEDKFNIISFNSLTLNSTIASIFQDRQQHVSYSLLLLFFFPYSWISWSTYSTILNGTTISPYHIWLAR